MNEPEPSMVFRADEINGKDIDNLLKSGIFVIQAGKIKDGSLVSGEPNITPYKTEVFSVTQTTATAVNVLTNVVNDSSVESQISTWLRVERSHLKDFILKVTVQYLGDGDSDREDSVRLYLDGLGGHHANLEFTGPGVVDENPLFTYFFPAQSPTITYDLLFCGAANWAVGETHNTMIIVEAFRLPSNVGTTPSRALL